MGSGGYRKDNDVLRVNLPQKTTGKSNGTGSSGGAPIDINQMCPQAFDERIKPKKSFPDGTPVTIRGEELLINDEFVGKLSKNHIKTITNCGNEGIRYRGRVLNRDGKSYARFEQKI